MQHNHELSDSAACDVRQLALRWADLDDRAKLMIDADLNILWANKTASDALGLGRDFCEKDGQLYTVGKGPQQDLRSLVGNCSVEVESWNFPRADDDGYLVCRAQKLSEGSEHRCVYGLSFFGTGKDFPRGVASVRGVYNLTTAQHRVMTDMLWGLSTGEVAARRHISVSTVRSHVKAIYSALSVSSREQMFFRLRPYKL